MLKVLIISEAGEAEGLATKIASEGIKVEYYANGNNCRFTEDKNPQRVAELSSAAQRADVILFDDVRQHGTRVFDPPSGRVVLGACPGIQKLANSPELFSQLLELTGYEVTPVNLNKAHSTIVTGGWFTDSGWEDTFVHSLKYNRLMEKNHGPLAQAGDVTWFTETDTLVKAALLPLTIVLKKLNYKGYFAIETKITDSNLYIHSVLPGIDFDACHTFSELRKGYWSRLLQGYALHSMDRVNVYSDRVGISIHLSLPPYPYTLNPEDVEHVNSQDIMQYMKIPESAIPHVHVNYNSAVVTAWGSTCAEAKKRAYRTVMNLKLDPLVQYRQDIGIGFVRTQQKLKELEWVN